jgi:hypothetical protein
MATFPNANQRQTSRFGKHRAWLGALEAMRGDSF